MHRDCIVRQVGVRSPQDYCVVSLSKGCARVCNGNAGPPGPHGTKDWAFTMDVTIKPGD
jgi:hypothetical protein